MKPAHKDLTYYRGSTDVCSIQWQDSAGVAIDLAGYTAAFTVRNAADQVIGVTGSGITASITANTGTVVFTITDQAAQALAIGVHRYDIWVTSSGGTDYPVLYGSFTVIEEVRNA